MRIDSSDAALIGLLWSFVLLFVAGYCSTGDPGFLGPAGMCGLGLLAAIEIATMFWGVDR